MTVPGPFLPSAAANSAKVLMPKGWKEKHRVGAETTVESRAAPEEFFPPRPTLFLKQLPARVPPNYPRNARSRRPKINAFFLFAPSKPPLHFEAFLALFLFPLLSPVAPAVIARGEKLSGASTQFAGTTIPNPRIIGQKTMPSVPLGTNS